MDLLIYGYVFCFGAIIGSFLNVVILRTNTGRTLGGRSMCFSCGKQLRSIELIPILSYLMQGGRCRSCGVRISPQYILIETLVGVLYMCVWMGDRSVLYLITSVIMLPLLVAIAVYDFRHMRIPTVWNYCWVIIAAIYGVLSVDAMFLGLGLIVPLLFFALWFFSNGRALGFGDVIFAIGMACIGGVVPALYAVWFASFFGSLYGITLMVVDRVHSNGRGSVTLTQAVPFGPFLVAGTVIMWLWGSVIMDAVIVLLYG